jgi:hypothetical protein
MTEIEPALVSIAEAIESLGIGRSKFYQMMNEGAVRTVNIGRRRLVPVAFLKTIGQNHAKPGPDRAERREIGQAGALTRFRGSPGDDGVREAHGLARGAGFVQIWEGDHFVHLGMMVSDRDLTPEQALYLAEKLERLAHRIAVRKAEP